MTQYITEGRSVVNAVRTVRLEITYKLIEHLRSAARNPRTHSKKQIQQIAQSIRIFGFLVPILVDADGNVIAGHGRLLAAKLLNMSEVPVICVLDLTQAQIEAFRIADNRLNENSEWDDRLLAEALKDLSEVNLDFDIEVTGFTTGQIDYRISGLSLSAAGEDRADEIPNENLVRVAKVDDLWLLNEHRLLCADARLTESFVKLMESSQAAMVFTDPPFNRSIHEHVTVGVKKHAEFPMASGEMSDQQFGTFLTCVFKLISQNTRDGAVAFIFMDWRHLQQVLQASRHAFSELKNICVWAKDRAGMGSFYRAQCEFVCVFKIGSAAHQNHFELGQHGRYRSNLWSYACPVAFGQSREESNLLVLHPTPKPTALVADAIMDVSRRRDIVLDPFLGSGTTLIAAERTGRTCYGLELDPQYVDLTIRRWQALTGNTAKHAASGRSFNELETEVSDVIR